MKYLSFLSLLLLGLPLVVFAQDSSFVPLTTNAPFLKEVGNADSLPLFLNSIYKICIGAAATLAVLQIMRAGIMYMGGDSVTEKKEAKNLIAMSIGGLILVLSPVVVFSIINPEILSLEISGLSQLASEVEDYETEGGGDGGPEGPTAPPPVLPGGEVHSSCQRYANGQVIPASDPTGEQCCQIQRSSTIECSVSWNYRTQPYVKYCGCSFKGILAEPSRYQVWRLQAKDPASGNWGLSDPRIVPKYAAAVEAYQLACREGGGAIEDKFLGFLERSVECDQDSGLPPLEEGGDRRYVCQNKEMICK